MPAGHSQTFKLERLQVRFEADESRVITRPFFPGGETRIGAIIDRVIGLSDPQVEEILARVFRDFQTRHKDIRAVFEEHCLILRSYLTSASLEFRREPFGL